MRMLVAENGSALATFLHESFSDEHYTVDLTGDGEEVQRWVEERNYDVVILDLNLVRAEAAEVVQFVRSKRRRMTILVLYSRNRAEERVQLLHVGADDLVLKPFAFSELCARVRALLRRGGLSAEVVLCIEDLELNRVEDSVKRAGRPIELTPEEFGLLEYLMRHAGQHVTRVPFIEHVWNLSFDTMFAFFVVLYSSAQIDKRKAGQLGEAIQVAFQQLGIFDAAGSKAALASAPPISAGDVQIIESVKRLQNLGRLSTSTQGSFPGSVDRAKVDALQIKLEDALALQIDDRIVSVKPNKEGIVVSLREAGFFHSGSTQLGPQTLPSLAAIVKIIGPEKVDIRIEGHTDNVPIHNEKYDSNWELSTARATEIIKLFITKFAVAPNRRSASGYAEYYPTASNETAEGRATNRRVDLVILNPSSDAGVPTPTVIAPDAAPLSNRAAVVAMQANAAKISRRKKKTALVLVRLRASRGRSSRNCRSRSRRSRSHGIRSNFFHHLRGKLLAHRAGSVVNAALRQSQRAAAVAALGIHSFQRCLFLLGIQVGKINVGQLSSEHRILQKYLPGVFERLDRCIHR
jgi:chemotaxis protein MotB